MAAKKTAGAPATTKTAPKKTTKKAAKPAGPAKKPGRAAASKPRRQRLGDVSALHGPVKDALAFYADSGALVGQIAKDVGSDVFKTKKALDELADKGEVSRPTKPGKGAVWMIAKKAA
jgi:hypothetical protein